MEKNPSNYSFILKSTDSSRTTLSEKEEGVIWDLFRNGNESAFIHIYQNYFEVLYSYGKKFCSKTDLVKDCIQDLFIHLRKNRSQLGPTDSIKFYLFKSLRRRILKEDIHGYASLDLESESKYFQFVFSHEQILIEEEIDSVTREKLNKAIATLSPRRKEIIYYFFYEGMSYLEIKEIMGLENIKSARNLLYQSLGFLRNSFR
ncbi:sigma-70 family RNA polymerase sigma factor [Algoriphagus confluentis]|uniref:Sigma-70 family RNA polymerase sigma factor n=1 Tax=Algoriphagus confluentis TaxID=1697556 RepID=A0ABQ6PLJ5_9BACT|nr:sigma-70 family RNA polymerase sigma factor [Algoriphagus confluentis]